MNEPRDIRTLLILLKKWCEENFISSNCWGLCSSIHDMYFHDSYDISLDEAALLREFIFHNLPMQITVYGVRYAWKIKELQPRLEWLQEQINKLDNKPIPSTP